MREVFLSTSSVEPHRRSEYWRELNSSLRDVSPVDDGGNSALEGSMQLWTFGTVAIPTHAFRAQRWRCEWHHVARGNAEHYRLMLVLAGNGKGDFNNTNLVCGPGDLLIVDSAQPYRMEVEAGRRLAMFIPRAALEKLVGRKNLHGLVLEHASPMHRNALSASGSACACSLWNRQTVQSGSCCSVARRRCALAPPRSSSVNQESESNDRDKAISKS
jgi:mannose-6-phosphate isomerase-like protein (cupin superfamily)